MRISTASQFDRSVDLIQRRQQALQASHEQLASGKRIARASDDPTQAASAERALAREARLDTHQRVLESSRQVMAQSESALGGAVDIMQRIRELVVQTGNAAAGDANRKVIADELRGLRQQLLGIANQQDANGDFLFAGQGGAAAPFVQVSEGVEFRGVAGSLASALGSAAPMSVDAEQTWMQAPTGNGVFKAAYALDPTAPASHQTQAWVDTGRVTDPASLTGESYSVIFTGDASAGYSFTITRTTGAGAPAAETARPYVSGQPIAFDGMEVTISGTPSPGRDTFEITPSTRDLSVFGVLDGLSRDLGASGRSGAQVAQTIQDGLRDLDSVMGSLMTMRSRIGWVMEQADGLDRRFSDGRMAAQSQRSAAEDVDMAKAITEFQGHQTSYDAALKAYSMVQRLSLFEYIR